MTPSTPPEPDAPRPAASATRTSTTEPKLFASVWRWHFYAGLLSIPIIVLLAISGIVYLFKPQIDAIAYSGLRDVAVQTQTKSYAAQQEAVLQAYPGATITQLAPAPAADRATEFDVALPSGDAKRVYVDPYTAQINGDRRPSSSFTTLALDLHGMLLTNRFLDEGGMWGDRIIELAASWAVVLVITGMYLWWPRGRKERRSFRRALIPRLNAKSQRTRWRDLHAVTGVMFGFVTLFFLVTGLAWAGIWGSKVWSPLTQKLGSTYPAGTYDGASSIKVEDLVKNGKAAWAAGSLPVPPSSTPASSGDTSGGKPGHTGHAGHVHAATTTWDPTKGAPIDAIVGRMQQLNFPVGSTISYPEDETGTYSVFRFADADVQPNGQASDGQVAYLDQYTALPIGQYDFSQFGALAKATDFGISLHEGREWGWVSQVFSLLGSLALLFSCASAIVMWRKRRPKGIGAPRRAPDRKFHVGVIAITIALGALFPMLGASILVLLAFDFIVVRHVPALGRALGAR